MDKYNHKKVSRMYQWGYRYNIIASLLTILIAEVMILLHQTGILVMVAN